MSESRVKGQEEGAAGGPVRAVQGVEAHLGRFPAFLKERAGEEPDWMGRLRQEGMARFASAGFPTTKEEAWRDTSLAHLARQPFVAAPEGAPGAALEVDSRRVAEAHLAVLVNGRVSPELSDLGRLPAGVTAASLAEVWRQGGPDLKEPLTGGIFQPGHVLAALNDAFMEDGLLIRLPEGKVLDRPVHLLNLVEAPEGPAAVHPRVLVLAGAGSQLHLVEEFAGRGRYFVNSVTDILLRPGAVVVHEKIVQESRTGGHVGAVRVRQENDSVFSSVNLSRAPGLVRNDLHVALSGKGADCTLSGLAWGEDDGHVDHHTVVDHAQPRCTSRQLYKGVLDGCSRGVFCGRVVVRPGAQKTSAWQTSKNLLLSADALASSIPQLEINADDVQCRHGSAIGQMDENMLFYLQSRGIAAQDARQVLTLAFACEILDRLRLPELRSRLHHQLLSGGAGKPDPAAGVEAM